MLTKNARHDWLLNYLETNKVHDMVDVLNRAFVEDFIEDCKPNVIKENLVGADTVPVLGRDLSELYKKGLLTRITVGIDNPVDGFPKWVYSYMLKNNSKNDRHT